MSKIKTSGLDQYGAEPFEQHHFGTAGVEGVKQYAPTHPLVISCARSQRKCKVSSTRCKQLLETIPAYLRHWGRRAVGGPCAPTHRQISKTNGPPRSSATLVTCVLPLTSNLNFIFLAPTKNKVAVAVTSADQGNAPLRAASLRCVDIAARQRLRRSKIHYQ